MSIYLDQIPKAVEFYTDDNSLFVHFNSNDSFLKLDYDFKVQLKDIDFLIESLKSIKNISSKIVNH